MQQTDIHFWSYLAQFFLQWEMFQNVCTENQNTHFVFSNFFFGRKSCRLWDNVQKCCKAGQATDDNMAHAHCMLAKAKNTHSEYVILIDIPLQQWLQERASMLRHMYTACLVASQNIVDGFQGRQFTVISHTTLRTEWPSVRRFSRTFDSIARNALCRISPNSC
jgi:hypothetical protein